MRCAGDVEIHRKLSHTVFSGNGEEGGDSLLPRVRKTGRHLVVGGVLDKTGLKMGVEGVVDLRTLMVNQCALGPSLIP